MRAIDATKCIDDDHELLRHWFEFGYQIDPVTKQKTGHVDLADCDGDVIVNVTAKQAQQIIALRNTYITTLIQILCDKP